MLVTGITVAGQGGGTVLYNGISLPQPWPPQRALTQVPETPPYLINPPSVIPIDLGRQLFVDNFLVEQTNLPRTFHRPVPYAGNPILEPGVWPDNGSTAQPFSDGVWYDPSDNLFKMWYDGGSAHVSYAISSDGMAWTKPVLPDAVVQGTNQVINMGGGRDSGTVWLDWAETDPARRFKAFIYGGGERFKTFFSGDGIHWQQQALEIFSLADRSTMFWNPFRQVWVKSARGHDTLPSGVNRPGYPSRLRLYAESTDLVNWVPGNRSATFWTGPDEDDPPYTENLGVYPQLYNLDTVAYESLLVGLFSWYYPAPDVDIVELGVGFSRDGFHWHRPKRGHGADAFIPASNEPGTWNLGNTQSAGGGFLVVGNELWFYFSGRETVHSVISQHRSTGLAKMRRDGFASMDAGAGEGSLTTRPIQFSGNRLFVNIDNPAGQLRAEVLDLQGNVIAPYSKANCVPVSANRTIHEIRWAGNTNLSAVAGQPVKVRFYLTNGRLYSFWVSGTGASNGYVAAGGPGFTGPTDTASPTEDINAPLVSITTPAFGSAVSGAIQLTASAADDVGVVGVRYQVGGQDIGSEVSSFPYGVNFNTSPFPDGTHTILAIARDAAGNVAHSLPIEIDIVNDAVPPTVALTSPVNGAVVSGTISLQANASDNVGVLGVQFKVDGSNLGAEDQTAPYQTSLEATTLSNGLHTATAIARDAAGNLRDSDPVEFEVANDIIGVFRPSNGALFLKSQNAVGFADRLLTFGLPGDKPVAGDWNGDDIDTIGAFRNGVFYLRNSNANGFADLAFGYGAATDLPVVGDWDGDGVDTIGVFRDGLFILRNSNTTGPADAIFTLGVAGDIPISGDWNGDGIDTVGIFRPSNGALYLKNQNSTGFADIVLTYGLPGDKPVTGDWDGNGTDTIGVFRNGTFMLRNSNTNGFAEIVFGLGVADDEPISGLWGPL